MPTGAAPGKGDAYHGTNLADFGNFRNEEQNIDFLAVYCFIFRGVIFL
jgi:hypothetical protein